jgi:hypothetical protein
MTAVVAGGARARLGVHLQAEIQRIETKLAPAAEQPATLLHIEAMTRVPNGEPAIQQLHCHECV